MSDYQPARGDFVFLNLDPRTGVELGKRRPALVVSETRLNIATGMAVVCPVTNTEAMSVFDVAIPSDSKLSGFVVSAQMRAIDWIAKGVSFHSQAPREVLDEVAARLEAILGLGPDA